MMSNFSFSNSIFKKLHTKKKSGLVWERVSRLLNNEILDQSKLKAFADDKLKVAQMAKFVVDKIENIVGKEENAGYQHFLLFPQCFQKASSLVFKIRDFVVKS